MRLLAYITAAGLVLVFSAASGAAEAKKKRPTTPASAKSSPTAWEGKALKTRQVLIDRMKASRERLKNSLPIYEEEVERRQADFEAKKELYSRDLISELEVRDAERAVAEKRSEVARVRQWITEDDIALSLAEEAAQEKSARLSALPVGGYEETATLVHFNGAARWSYAIVQKIAKFYQQKFHRALPISALGQSATHDRMGLDHSEALDIGVHPSSREGRSLIAFLKKNGIPFIAFRSAVRNVSTGAHIHVGKPSPRIVEAKAPVVATEVHEKNPREARAQDRTSG